ncbi:uncharacterized protein LOC128909675 [Rissa tridactyla]|uniref:uncharacterized protein LOC128909675 n=1 Tax=Rissa tridactyla TaxID=75485 RepID=UPI0023BAAC05|nr:uncharacterized protein LOC128909675 [Rissa tridactyla]
MEEQDRFLLQRLSEADFPGRGSGGDWRKQAEDEPAAKAEIPVEAPGGEWRRPGLTRPGPPRRRWAAAAGARTVQHAAGRRARGGGQRAVRLPAPAGPPQDTQECRAALGREAAERLAYAEVRPARNGGAPAPRRRRLRPRRVGRKAGPAGERSGAGAARRSPAGWCAQLGRVPPSSPAAENITVILRTSCLDDGPLSPSLPPEATALTVSDICCPLPGVHSFLLTEWAEYNPRVFYIDYISLQTQKRIPGSCWLPCIARSTSSQS